MWSNCSKAVEYGVITATVCCILQSCEFVLSSLSKSGLRSSSIPKVYSGGKGGIYHGWGIIQDYILLDFCTKRPTDLDCMGKQITLASFWLLQSVPRHLPRKPRLRDSH